MKDIKVELLTAHFTASKDRSVPLQLQRKKRETPELFCKNRKALNLGHAYYSTKGRVSKQKLQEKIEHWFDNHHNPKQDYYIDLTDLCDL